MLLVRVKFFPTPRPEDVSERGDYADGAAPPPMPRAKRLTLIIAGVLVANLFAAVVYAILFVRITAVP